MGNFSVMYFIRLGLHRLWALILAGIICAAGAFCYCRFFTAPYYTASVAVVLNSNKSTVVTTDTVTGEAYIGEVGSNLTGTVLDILKTTDIYRQVAQKLDGQYTWWSIRSGMSIAKRSEESLFVDITYTASSAKEAIAVVNTFAELAPEYVSNFIPKAMITVISPAENASQSATQTRKMVLLGGIVGVVLAYAIVFLIDFNDKVIKGEEDFTATYDLPLLGSVPNFDNSDLSSTKYLGGY